MAPDIQGFDHIHVFVSNRPAAGRWYAEVLGPYLKKCGHYVAAVVDPASASEKSRRYLQRWVDGLL